MGHRSYLVGQLFQAYSARIYLNGPGTTGEDFCDNLADELIEKAPPRRNTKIHLNTKFCDPLNDAWKQGSTFVGTGTIGQLWVSKSEFSDNSKKLHYF